MQNQERARNSQTKRKIQIKYNDVQKEDKISRQERAKGEDTVYGMQCRQFLWKDVIPGFNSEMRRMKH